MKRNILITLSTLAVCVLVGPMAALAQAQRGGGTVALDPVAKEALLTALVGPDGEYAAQAEYTAILAKFGATVQPYANILLAERQHVAALQQQCTKFGVPIPADPYLGQVNPPATLLEAIAETLNPGLQVESRSEQRADDQQQVGDGAGEAIQPIVLPPADGGFCQPAGQGAGQKDGDRPDQRPEIPAQRTLSSPSCRDPGPWSRAARSGPRRRPGR